MSSWGNGDDSRVEGRRGWFEKGGFKKLEEVEMNDVACAELCFETVFSVTVRSSHANTIVSEELRQVGEQRTLALLINTFSLLLLFRNSSAAALTLFKLSSLISIRWIGTLGPSHRYRQWLLASFGDLYSDENSHCGGQNRFGKILHFEITFYGHV